MTNEVVIQNAISTSVETPDWFMPADQAWEKWGSFSEFQNQVVRMAAKEHINISANLIEEANVIHIKFFRPENMIPGVLPRRNITVILGEYISRKNK